MKYNIPRGTFDILPEDSYKWQFLQDSFRKFAICFGYQEITTPFLKFQNSLNAVLGKAQM
jgi:histidyl-tRNA synthetase